MDTIRALAILGFVALLFILPLAVALLGSRLSPNLGWVLCLITWWGIAFVSIAIFLGRRFPYMHSDTNLSLDDASMTEETSLKEPLDKVRHTANIREP